MEFFSDAPQKKKECDADNAFIKRSREDRLCEHAAVFTNTSCNWNSFIDYVMRISVTPEPMREESHPSGLRLKIYNSPVSIAGNLTADSAEVIRQHQSCSSCIT